MRPGRACPVRAGGDSRLGLGVSVLCLVVVACGEPRPDRVAVATLDTGLGLARWVDPPTPAAGALQRGRPSEADLRRIVGLGRVAYVEGVVASQMRAVTEGCDALSEGRIDLDGLETLLAGCAQRRFDLYAVWLADFDALLRKRGDRESLQREVQSVWRRGAVRLEEISSEFEAGVAGLVAWHRIQRTECERLLEELGTYHE